MADSIEYKIDIDAEGKKTVEELLKKISELEKSMGDNATRGAKKLHGELQKIKAEILKTDYSKIGKDAFKGVTEHLGKVEKSIGYLDSKGRTSMSVYGTLVNVLKGDTGAIVDDIEKAVKGTEAWGKAVGKLGLAKVAGAMSLAVYGIGRAISGFKEWAAIERSYKERELTDGIELQGARARQAQRSFARRNEIRDRDIQLNDISLDSRIARRANAATVRDNAIDMELNTRLSGATSDREREILTSEAKWKKEKLRLEDELADLADEEAKANFRREKNEEKNREAQRNIQTIMDAQAKIAAQKGSDEGKLQNRDTAAGHIYKGLGFDSLETFLNAIGLSDNEETTSNLEKRVESAKNQEEEIKKILEEALQNQKNSIVDTTQIQADLDKIAEQRKALESKRKQKESERSLEAAERKKQDDISKMRAERTVELEGRDREEADIEALNAHRLRRGGPLAGLGVAQDTYERRKEQLYSAKRKEEELASTVRQRLINEGKIDEDTTVNLSDFDTQKMMTGEEKEKYQQLHSDVIDYTNKERSAKNELTSQQIDRENRAAQFRANAMQQGNRLTAMGLGGDVSADFAKSTAGNTKELVSLTKEMLKHFQGGMQGKRLEDNVNRWTT